MRRAASVARGAFRARPFGVDFPEPHAHLRPGGARWLAASPSVTRPVVDPRAPLTAGGINAVRAYTSDDDTRRMNPAVVVGASRGGLCPTCSSAVQPMWPKALLPNEVGVHGADNGPTYWCASCKDVCKDPIRRGGAHGSNDDGVTGFVDTNGGISGALHYPAMSPTARAPQSSSLGFTSHGMLPTAVPGGSDGAAASSRTAETLGGPGVPFGVPTTGGGGGGGSVRSF